jgi:hypothetical protein
MAPRRRGPAVEHAHPQNRRRTYLGDVRAAPVAVMEGGEPTTPYLGLWVDADTGLVVSTVVALERPAETLAEALLDPRRALAAAPADLDDAATGALAALDAYELPGRALVFDPALAAALQPRPASSGIALEVPERIDAFEELFDSLLDLMRTLSTPTHFLRRSGSASLWSCITVSACWSTFSKNSQGALPAVSIAVSRARPCASASTAAAKSGCSAHSPPLSVIPPPDSS